MQFSAMVYSFCRPLERGEITLPKLLEFIAQTGFSGVDLDYNYISGFSPQEFRHRTQDLQLHIPSMTVFAPLTTTVPSERSSAIDKLTQAAQYAQEVGAASMLIVAGFCNPAQREQARSNVIEALKQCIDNIVADTLTPTIEPFPGIKSPFVTAQEVNEVCTALAGRIKVTFDFANAATAGEEPFDTLQLLREQIVHCHAKNWRVSADEPQTDNTFCQGLDGNYYAGTQLSQGILDIEAIILALLESGYNGYCGWEHEAADDPFAAAKNELTFLQHVVTHALQ